MTTYQITQGPQPSRTKEPVVSFPAHPDLGIDELGSFAYQSNYMGVILLHTCGWVDGQYCSVLSLIVDNLWPQYCYHGGM